MDILHFVGKVLPSSINITIGFRPEINWKEPELGYEAMYVVAVQDSNIDVEVRIPQFDANDPVLFSRLYARVFDMARAAVDVVAFSMGYGTSVVFTELVLPNGHRQPFPPVVHPELAALCTSYSLEGAKFDEVYSLAISDYQHFMALRDLIEAITIPHIAPISCGRVIDAIRRIISPNEKDAAKGWKAMHAALNVSREYQEWISKLAANPRHADRSFIVGPTVNETLRRTWIIMDRLIAYKKADRAPLVHPTFPRLTE
ncbi:MAG TPA: hypothetical protein VF901_14675 [Bradyrhizobium sp.]